MPKVTEEYIKNKKNMIIRAAYDLCIQKTVSTVTMQDIIGVGSEGRMNTPSTLGGNWEWRATADQINNKLAARLYKYTEMYGRLNR